MAQVYLIYRVLPENPEVDYEKLKSNIKITLEPKYRVERIDEEEIGFGIKALKVHVKMPEESKEHSSDEIESRLSSIEGVGSIELEYFTRVEF